MKELSRLVPNRECKNTGSIYGDSYFYLRGEKISELLDRRGENDFHGVPQDNLKSAKEGYCLIVDSMLDKSSFVSRLSEEGWSRVYLRTGERFGSTSEIWIYEKR